MIDTIVFDIGMVMVNFCWEKYLRSFQYSEDLYQSIAEAMFLSPQWNEYDRGELTDQEMLALFIRNRPEYKKQIKEVFANLGKTIEVYDYTENWIRRLRAKGYKVYYLSNFSKRTLVQGEKEMKFHKEMDGGLFSFDIKKIKPEREIYQIFIEKFNIKPERAVFLDDNRKNLEGAKPFGFHTILFTSKEKAEKELHNLGVEW
ncbi:HAD family hydrolase [Anaerosacchariphilus polymeriproducens]|uniref:HAD family phosphatase n=1 Tax=Anaerosacchariphilus polymeriproducens TaxID=1812858 RepID=A0A371AWI2_9FIRM|nr:HAD family phosphatase [Anaerosacchariphilus polymeriproducens]RDU23892.1 HAD family phosphatase [Anaerosacchariphilus polymeriproducens]